MLILSYRSVVKSFSGSSYHWPTRVIPSLPLERWWLCCASMGQGMLPAIGVVRVTLSFLSVSAWCCLRCFSGVGDSCQISIQRTCFSPSEKKRCEAHGSPAASLLFWRVLKSPTQLLCCFPYCSKLTDTNVMKQLFIYTVIAQGLLGKCHLQ